MIIIRSFSGPYFPAFGLNTERYGVFECRKIQIRKTPNTDTFYSVVYSESSQTSKIELFA